MSADAPTGLTKMIAAANVPEPVVRIMCQVWANGHLSAGNIADLRDHGIRTHEDDGPRGVVTNAELEAALRAYYATGVWGTDRDAVRAAIKAAREGRS